MGYHDTVQVLVGAALGLVCGLGWSGLVSAVEFSFAAVEASPWLSALALRDSWHLPHAPSFERGNCIASRSRENAKET